MRTSLCSFMLTAIRIHDSEHQLLHYDVPLHDSTPAEYWLLNHRYSISIRPGKLDLLFHISHSLDLRAGGRSLFIIHC